MKEIFVKRSIEVLPKEGNIYPVIRYDDNIYFLTWTGTEDCRFIWQDQVKAWLEPLTPEQFLSENLLPLLKAAFDYGTLSARDTIPSKEAFQNFLDDHNIDSLKQNKP